MLHLLRQQGRLLIRIETLEAHLNAAGPASSRFSTASPAKGLPAGVEAPAFRLPTTRGEIVTLDTLLSDGKPVMLIFIDPNCGPCLSLLPEVVRWQQEHADQLTIALISRGAATVNQSQGVEHDLTHLLLQQDREVAQAYQVKYTPSAIIVLPDGVTGSSLVSGVEVIQLLLKNTVEPSGMIPTSIHPSDTINPSSVWTLVAQLKQDGT